MRVLVVLLLALPAVAAAPEAPVTYGVSYELPDAECLDCVEVSGHVAQTEPKNCADCGGIGVSAGVERDEDGTTASAQVCRGGFVVICVVDEERTIPL